MGAGKRFARDGVEWLGRKLGLVVAPAAARGHVRLIALDGTSTEYPITNAEISVTYPPIPMLGASTLLPLEPIVSIQETSITVWLAPC